MLLLKIYRTVKNYTNIKYPLTYTIRHNLFKFNLDHLFYLFILSFVVLVHKLYCPLRHRCSDEVLDLQIL